ncbi:MAG: hypothetical protein K2M46_11180 [Lachnospiraceae bacterium]|nr:hypothetical protein [Lachnospiraceae bacterium]
MKKIRGGQLIYPHSLIIGDNASGKSELIRKLVEEKLQAQERVYFIDSVNRYFDVSKIDESKVEVEKEITIVEKRISLDYFNTTDSFSMYGTDTERIEWIYRKYESQVQELLKDFCNFVFTVEHKKEKLVKYQGQQEGKLSNGVQALVRIFLEMLYLQEIVNDNEVLLVIDELDEFLSPSNAAKIFPFLLEKFPNMKFVISTHSADLVRTAKECNLIILHENNYEMADVSDFESAGEVKYVFDKVFSMEEQEEDRIENILRKLLNNKMLGAWNSTDETEFQNLKEEQLSNAQKILYKRIEEW